ncbi:ASCH domain-containing protein [Corallococcus coralloides]|uniref:ASCH domain-containing protein n=1 Tax=Corallococcus coralloides TaxID=184914 RepID=UPI00384D093F
MSDAPYVGGRTLLLSIRPNYVHQILKGEKTVELRRKRPGVQPSDPVLIYASAPTYALVGVFIVESIIEDSPTKLWGRIGKKSGISAATYRHYFEGAASGVALSILSVWEAPNSISLKELRVLWPGFSPPQSYRYISFDLLAKLPGKWRSFSQNKNHQLFAR